MHLRSGHARAIRPAADRALARQLDGPRFADPEHPDVTWTYSLRDGHFEVERDGPEGDRRLLIEYAFGSGHHATTFVSLTDNDPEHPTGLEHRLSYFGVSNSLGITPGQAIGEDQGRATPIGRALDSDAVRKCFGCHTSALSNRGPGPFDPSTLIPNITCERCHGSGADHIEVARSGTLDSARLAMPHGPGRASADAQMKLCGACHRHPSQFSFAFIRPGNPEVVRYQPIGLMMSACYVKSRAGLSCTTCHNPHGRTSYDRETSESVCLSCHDGRHHEVSQATCPVSPAGDCLRCHMPERDSGQGIMFTDHWIRIHDVTTQGGPASP